MMNYSLTLDDKIYPDEKNKNEKVNHFSNYLRNMVNCFVVGIDYLIHHENEYADFKDKVLIILDPELKIPHDLRVINMEEKPTIYLIIESKSYHEKKEMIRLKEIKVLNLYSKNKMNLNVLSIKYLNLALTVS